MRYVHFRFGFSLALCVLLGLLLSACGDNTATAIPIVTATSAPITTAPRITTPATTTVASVATTTASTTTSAATTASSTLPQLLFVGNSLVSGYGLSNTDSFPYQTWKLLGMDKYDMQNLGMNSNYGGTTTEMLTYSPAIDALYAASRKNIIVVLEGLNDWGSGVTSDKAYQNLADYCKARKDKGYKVVIVTLIGVAGEQPFPVADFEKHQQFVNTAIRKNWQNYADAIADVATDPNIGTNRAELTEYYQSDGRHLSPKGAEIIAQIVKNAVIKL